MARLTGDRTKTRRVRTILLLCLLAFSLGSTAAEGVRAVTLLEGLQHPWGLAFLPDGRVLITERPGRLLLARLDGSAPQPVDGLPEITASGQGGLLDVALHPRFADNGWVYLSYVAGGGLSLGTEVGRGRLVDGRLVDWQVLFRMAPKSGGGRHFGSRLVFDRDGYLFVTLGDRGDRDRAQALDDHAGSVIRLHDDGRVPADNPFVGRDGARVEIWSLGHRNIQGAALHPQSGRLWVHEHGPQGGDEINLVDRGNNYGWPVITYGEEYVTGFDIGEGSAKPGLEQPVHYWVPSIAPSGMAFYAGDRLPDWRGSLLVGSLKFRQLVRLRLDGDRVVDEERLFTDQFGRIRDVRSGPDGLVYLLTDASNGRLIRLEPDR